MAQNKSDSLSAPVSQRLSEYLLILEHLKSQGQDVVSSRVLADSYGNNASQVRHDLFQIESTGSRSHGYDCKNLSEAIRSALNLEGEKRLCVIGMGNLGRAIATHVPFQNYGMKLSATFDIDPTIIGRKFGQITVSPSSSLEATIRDKKITMAALCVPAEKSQSSCDLLIKMGVKGILNYSRMRLKVPKHVYVQDEQIICSFLQLSYKTSL